MLRRIGIVIGVLALAGAAGWWRWDAVHNGSTAAIRGSGIVEVTEVDVAFEVPGRIVERFADEGLAVDKGEPIARLDEREYHLQRERAQAAHAAADARYRLLLKGPRGEEIDQALSALEAAETALTTQQRDFQRVKALFESSVVSRAEFDRVNAAFTAATATRDQARSRLAILRQGARTEELEEGRARLREAERAEALADLNLERCRLFAPIAGRVLSKNREVGETVAPGASIVTLGDLTRPWLNLYVGERDLGRVRLGMKAEVSIDSFPERPFPGRVSFVSDQAEFTPRNIQTRDERVKLVYRVKIELENRDGALKPGMPADAVIADDQVAGSAS